MQGVERKWGRGKGFWVAREVRQDCPLSPLLFNILIVDLEEEISRVKWGE